MAGLPIPRRVFKHLEILMTQQTGRIARRVLVSALSLTFGTAAYAGFYPGHIDPGGNGDDIPGFTADVVFDIPDGCFTDGAGWKATNQNVGASGGCGDASVVSGTVYLYTTSSSPPAGSPLDSFALDPLDPWPILGVYSVGGALEGVDTDPMGAYSTTGVYSSDLFWLQFVSGFCDVGCTPPGGFPDFDPAYLSVNDINNFGPPGTVIFGPECRTADNCVVVPSVPEPGTLALLFGALGGGWLARRRKRNAAS
jgi:hypothetical protein